MSHTIQYPKIEFHKPVLAFQQFSLDPDPCWTLTCCCYFSPFCCRFSAYSTTFSGHDSLAQVFQVVFSQNSTYFLTVELNKSQTSFTFTFTTCTFHNPAFQNFSKPGCLKQQTLTTVQLFHQFQLKYCLVDHCPALS